eukprot:Hpha_TRINITY_DN14658_c0_g1::TRINITY_DN14658_c0_g1_i1::g.48426::m.48426/K03083/GSK3B; glycogen synthase kinase 3 beta
MPPRSRLASEVSENVPAAKLRRTTSARSAGCARASPPPSSQGLSLTPRSTLSLSPFARTGPGGWETTFDVEEETTEFESFNLSMSEGTRLLNVPEGRYEGVKHLSSEGSFGHVFRGKVRSSGRNVVIKSQPLEESCEVEAAYRELRCLVHCTTLSPHPSLVEVLDSWLKDGVLYIVEERLGGTLSDWIHRRYRDAQEHSRSYEVPLVQRKRIMVAVWSGLAHLHSCNIIHRDFKPQNVVVDDNLERVKLIDFGSCRRPLQPGEKDYGPHPMTEGRFVCSYRYRAPEIYTSHTDYTPSVDTWSGGCLAAELLLGHALFNDNEAGVPRQHEEFFAAVKSPLDLKARVPRATVAELDMLFKTLLKDPAKRVSCEVASRMLKGLRGAHYGNCETESVELVPPHYRFEDSPRIKALMCEVLDAWKAAGNSGVRTPRGWPCERRRLLKE